MTTPQQNATTPLRRDPSVASLAPASSPTRPGSPVAGLYPPKSADEKKRLLAFIADAPFGFGFVAVL
jgi:hypothetical protein